MKLSGPSIQWYYKQFIADDKVLAMDWDAIGMHVWLINIGCQQDPAGTIPDDVALIRRWLRSPSDDIWRRVWPQLNVAWPVTDGRRANAGTVRACEKARAFSDSRREGAYALHKRRIRDAQEVEEEIVVEVDVGSNKTKEVLVSLELSSLNELVYDSYPRKVGRAKGIESIRKAVRKISKQFDLADNESVEYLHKAVIEFARSPAGQKGEYTPHCATWMNQERWNDDRKEWYRESGAATKQQGNSRAAARAFQRVTGMDHFEADEVGEELPRSPNGGGELSRVRGNAERYQSSDVIEGVPGGSKTVS